MVGVTVGYLGLLVLLGWGAVLLLRRVVARVRLVRARRAGASEADHFAAWSAQCDWRTQRLARRVK